MKRRKTGGGEIREDPRIKSLVRKIVSGKGEWTNEDLQLYQNNSEEVERLLRKETNAR